MDKDIAYKQLSKFVGCWNTSGLIPATETGAEMEVKGTDIYEWLPGKHFLLHKVDVFVGDDKNETTEIIGFDRSKNCFTMQHYDNKGNSGFMTANCTNDVWVYQGEGLRFTGGFSERDCEFSGIWEQSSDGQNWTHLMHIKLIKAG